MSGNGTGADKQAIIPEAMMNKIHGTMGWQYDRMN